ncbi:hypothetical protein VIN7_8506 [Saccharomyces cerevisiae x Saccharomyces kudriavzevii VIN7]|uniref:Uncharacterized protein n=1 Tax=Saccharomyces cerevisiae x Saccharomyces kudriavzevii (strain VIN7) TaxID=1095631 RepID=H0GXV5_SACCK|nr:hypothetical protein VIN7_8506 [Saccharomyces cerevisiae x Saccharomyces kudriavzevii VIN7]
MLYCKCVLSKRLIHFPKKLLGIRQIQGLKTGNMSQSPYLFENKVWNTRCFFSVMGTAEKHSENHSFSLKKDKSAKVKSFEDFVPYFEEALQVCLGSKQTAGINLCGEGTQSC